MWKSTTLRLIYLAIPWALLAACGGHIAGDGAGDDNGGGGSCVNIDITTYDRSCQSASDCVTVSAGPICNGGCACGGATINVDGQSRYEDAVSSVATESCPCPSEPAPACIDGTCTVCTFGPNDPPGCATYADASVPDATGPECVYIDLTTYDLSCRYDSDCTEITAGEICTDGCSCGGSAINVDGAERYTNESAFIQTEACPCAASGAVRCVAAVCTVCEPGGDCGVSVDAGP